MSLTSIVRSAVFRRAAGLGPERRAILYSQIWVEAAETLGADLETLGEGFFRIRRDGRATLTREHLVELDHPSTVALGRARPIVHRMLAARGLPVPDAVTVELSDLEPAIRFLRGDEGAVVIKPAADTAGGDGVTMNVTSPGPLRRAVAYAALFGSRVLVERQVAGDGYRLLYLDGVLLDALRRTPPRIVGDGRSSVRALVGAENARRLAASGAAGSEPITFSLDALTTLHRAGWTPFSVPPAGTPVVVKSATSEAAERERRSAWNEIGGALAREGALAAKTIGLRFAAIDVITADPRVSLGECGGRIVEVNPSPTLHPHYQIADPARRLPVAVPILERLLEEARPED